LQQASSVSLAITGAQISERDIAAIDAKLKGALSGISLTINYPAPSEYAATLTFTVDGQTRNISISGHAAELAWLDSYRNNTGAMSFAASDYDRETIGALSLTLTRAGALEITTADKNAVEGKLKSALPDATLALQNGWTAKDEYTADPVEPDYPASFQYGDNTASVSIDGNNVAVNFAAYNNSAAGALSLPAGLAAKIAGKSGAVTIGGAAADFVALDSAHYIRKAFKDAKASAVDITTARTPVFDAQKWLKLDRSQLKNPEDNLYKNYTAASTAIMPGVNIVKSGGKYAVEYGRQMKVEGVQYFEAGAKILDHN
jgi:hypothetical protein